MSKDSPSLQSSLGKARGLGSAKDGTHHWIMQRVTSIALMPLCLYLLWQLPHIVDSDLANFSSWIDDPINAVALLLFIAVAFHHAALGVQVIIEDYVHTHFLKFGALLLNQITFLFLGIAGIYAVIRLSFGA